MKITLFAVLWLLSVPLWYIIPTFAHGNGVILTNEISQGYQVRLEHEIPELTIGEPTLISIEVEQNEELLEIESIFVRITNDLNQVVWSGLVSPEELIPKIVRIIATFEKQGEHTISLRIKLSDIEDTLRTEYSVDVKPARISFFTEWGTTLIIALLSLLFGIALGAKIWLRKI